MTFKDWDECLKYLDTLTKWPPVVLYLALIFRGAIAKKLSGLEKIKVKETEIIFRTLKKVAAEASPELLQQFILKVPIASIVEGEKDADDKEAKDTDDESPTDVEEDEPDDETMQAEKSELDEALKKLQE